MNCKNCHDPLQEEYKYCSSCGAQVVSERISIKRLTNNFLSEYFGWDNRFLITIKALLIKPEVICKEYLDGVRRKYVAPFAFLAIGTALAMLLFNEYSDKYLELANMVNNKQYELIEEQFNHDESEEVIKNHRLESIELNTKIQSTILKYFNIFTFLMVPFYALVTFLVYRKPYNYGEHLVIVSYLQGLIFLSSLLFFVLALKFHPALYYCNLLVAVFLYLNTYRRLYKESFARTILRLLKFIAIVLGFLIVFMLIGFLVGLLSRFLSF